MLLLAFCAALILPAGCGYSLLGRGGGSFDLEDVRVESPPGLWETGLAFREALDAAGVAVSRESPIVVAILDERSFRNPLSTTADGNVAEYELRLEVDLSIAVDDEQRLEKATLTADRSYAVDSQNLAASQEEQALVLKEAREALARQMVRRLKAVSRGRT